MNSLDLKQAVAFLKQKISSNPTLGIILGTGSGGVADRIEDSIAIPFSNVPGFVRSTATGHKGRIIFGTFAGNTVIAMQGRFHRYEGWSVEQTVFPLQVMIGLGIERLVVTNAAGGVDPKMNKGDLVLLESHIDLLSYWQGGRDFFTSLEEVLGQRPAGFRSDDCYNFGIRETALKVARAEGIPVTEGVYLGLHGPTYETRAEYRLARKIGADVVGMSTVTEAAVASFHQIPTLAISVVTNVAKPDALAETDGHEVVMAAKEVEQNVATLIEKSF